MAATRALSSFYWECTACLIFGWAFRKNKTNPVSDDRTKVRGHGAAVTRESEPLHEGVRL
jgi:hypothetical protein